MLRENPYDEMPQRKHHIDRTASVGYSQTSPHSRGDASWSSWSSDLEAVEMEPLFSALTSRPVVVLGGVTGVTRESGKPAELSMYGIRGSGAVAGRWALRSRLSSIGPGRSPSGSSFRFVGLGRAVADGILVRLPLVWIWELPREVARP
jgi:hypothetical protein